MISRLLPFHEKHSAARGVAPHGGATLLRQRDNGELPLRIYLPQRVAKLHLGGTTLILLIIILLVLMFASFPAYPYSRGWGYYPSGGLGTILLIVIILWLLHVI